MPLPPAPEPQRDTLALHGAAAAPAPIPDYLQDTYWWAYTHPRAVRVFERQWLVNAILWGNFARLRDWAVQALSPACQGQILQVAAVYGDFTPRLARALGPQGRLDVIDVAPVQIANLHAKLGQTARVHVSQQDASALRFADASFDAVVLFFLLHEMPADVRSRTLAQALRVLRPGGRLVLVDYHRPHALNPMRALMWPVLKRLEPFALDLWRAPIATWFPPGFTPARLSQQTCFGGLYQMILIER